MSRGVRDLRQLISQSRLARADDSSEDDESHSQTTDVLSSSIG